MNTLSENTTVFASLQRLTDRVRWKRWLGKCRRFTSLIALLFLSMFLADLAIGLRTFTLRACLTGFALAASVWFVVDWLTCWSGRLDVLGLAQILERRHPSLAERLLTLVQIESDPSQRTNPAFAALLGSETAQQLATIEPEAACPLDRERRAWLMTALVLGIALIGLSFAPAFREFSSRLFASWTTPLAPYQIDLVRGSGYALRGSSYKIEGTIKRLDPYAPDAIACRLVNEGDSENTLVAAPIRAERFEFALDSIQHPLHCRVALGDTLSDLIEIRLIEAPVLTSSPKFAVTPPPYLELGTKSHELTANGSFAEILQYSRMALAISFDQPCRGTLALETTTDEKDTTWSHVPFQTGANTNQCVVDLLASRTGMVRAELRLDLAHGLSTSIKLGSWSVHADRMPRFTQSLRFLGSSQSLQSKQQVRISPDDIVRLETEVADDEGLSAIDVEYRLNDDPPRVVPWINAAGKQLIAINERMPLPRGMKQGDRIQFRLRASDNRVIGRGEIDANSSLPSMELKPQTAFAPHAFGGDDAWIQLVVDPSIESFLKQQAEAQRDEVNGVLDAIKKKILDEAEQVEKMKRSIHLQAALTLDQRLQTEKLQAHNREVIEDLLQAGQRFLLNPELARLAEHLLDIAETEMHKAGLGLERFGEKDRPLAAGERELQAAHAALMQAIKKLDRVHDWNKMLAQDRLDQAQIDKLAQRQQDLADRLDQLRAKKTLSEADLAKQIEAIRQEQARIAQQTDQLKDQNQLVQESLAAMERQRVEKLAMDAQSLAAEQQSLREMSPEKMPAELTARHQDLAQRQADMAARVKAKPARDAADAHKKPSLDRAIDRQKAQEKQLHNALGELLPGVVADELREQILRLAMQQKRIRADLERVGQELSQLNETMVKERLKKLVARQRELQTAIAKLPIDVENPTVRAGQQRAELSAQKAGDLLAAKDALESFLAMEKTQQDLEILAALLPQTLVKDRTDIKDPVIRAKVDQVEQFAEQQKKLRKETEQLRADWMKAVAGKDDGRVREKMDQLAKELLELAQQGTSPKAKAMAKETASAFEKAKQAMEAGNDAKGKGEPSAMQDADAAKQLDLAVKQLQKFAQEQAQKEMNKENPEKTAEALRDSADQMKIAEAKLPHLPKDAQAAMNAAAQKLAQAADQASKQASRSIPKAARSPSAKAGPRPGSGNASTRDLKLESFKGKAWGELPGELKTRMVQDFRARYGDEYAEVIQQYFERLAQSPNPNSTQKK